MTNNSNSQITFVAVNCWHPNGDCRRHFSKVHHFPVLIAYPSLRGKGIQYRGIKRASHMARFLKTMLRPLVRVENSTDVLHLLASHDVNLKLWVPDFKSTDDFCHRLSPWAAWTCPKLILATRLSTQLHWRRSKQIRTRKWLFQLQQAKALARAWHQKKTEEPFQLCTSICGMKLWWDIY